jgi:DNA-binding IclR family transcriptional regulator
VNPEAVAQGGYNVARTLQALEILAARPVTATELSDVLKIHPRTARRILQRLVLDGYATKGDGYLDPFAATSQLRNLGLKLAGAFQSQSASNFAAASVARTSAPAHVASPASASVCSAPSMFGRWPY